MKLFLILVGMAVSGYVGYLMEPALRPAVTGNSPKLAIDPALPKQGGAPALESGIDPSTLAPEQLPAQVTVNTEIKFSDGY